MKVSAKLKYLRIAPRKVRLVANMIRGKKAEKAQSILNFTVKGASRPMLKLLNSALANAKSIHQLESTDLYISKIEVNEGPKLKRWRARARGQAAEIQKKTSHIEITLEAVKGRKVVKKTKAVEKSEIKTEEKKENKPKIEKMKFRPRSESFRENSTQGMKRVFRRKTV
jgi:large subunit ribosomal protein L22